MLEDRDEQARLAAPRGYGVLDTPNEAEFDAIVRDAARVLGTPIALIALVDEKNRQWFKAKVGLEASETPRSISFCTHAIRGPDILIVEDATLDDRFAANPLVIGDPNIRFYAGTPLKTSTGKRIGTLCVIDSKPHRTPSPDQQSHLTALADKTIIALEERAKRNRPTNV